MKNLTLTLLAAAGCWCSLAAQEVDQSASAKTDSAEYINVADQDTTRLQMGNTKVLIIGNSESGECALDSNAFIDEPSHQHWQGIDIGINGWMSSPGSVSLPAGFDFLEIDYGKSFYASINFYEHNTELIDKRLRIVSGMGLDYNSYAFNQNITLDPTNGEQVSASNDSIGYEKNKLRVTSLTVPLMIGLNTNDTRKRSFRMAAGVVGRYAINTKTKQKYVIDGVTYKPKVKDDFNLNPFSILATVRMGYGNFNLYASYGLTELFQQGKGPELHAWTAGVSVLI